METADFFLHAFDVTASIVSLLSGSISVSKLWFRSILGRSGRSDKIGAEGVIVVFCGLFPKNESCDGEGE